MTNANGFNESIFVGLETTFKNPPGTPAGYKLPVMNPSLKPTVQRFTSEALTGSAQPRKPVDGKVSLAVTFDLECNSGSLGPVLSGLMATETLQGAGAYRAHVITLGTPDSWYAEQQFDDISQNMIGKGCRYDKASFTFDPEGLMKASISLRGALTSISATPFTITETDKTQDPPLSYLYSTMKYDGAAVTDLQEVKLDIDRQAEDVKTIDGTNELADIITKIAMVKGSLKALFTDASYINDALNSTETSLEFFVPSSVLGYGLWVTLPTLLLQPAGPTTNGPGGLVTQEFSFDAYGATSTSKLKGFSVSAPFTSKVITAANDAFIVAFNGGGDITIDVPDGTYTPATYAAALNADVTFAAAGTAFAFNGSVIIETDTAGSSGSVQVKTSEANTDFLAFATAAYSGLSNQAVRFVVLNSDTAVYA